MTDSVAPTPDFSPLVLAHEIVGCVTGLSKDQASALVATVQLRLAQPEPPGNLLLFPLSPSDFPPTPSKRAKK